MTSTLDKKITQALRLIESASKIAQEHGQPLEIAYSGGKDSDVILELARMAGVTYRAIYKNTTIDPPGTISHAIRQGAEMLRPEYSFRQLIERNGFPHRLRRHCCRFLKEYKVLDYSVLGVRREESSRRAERYKEPEQCRVYGNGEKTRQYFPILDWTSEDIRLFAIRQGIRFHPLYYDADDNFHPERRLGCMGCPLKYRKTRLDDFRQHPGVVKLYLGGVKSFYSTILIPRPHSVSVMYMSGLPWTCSVTPSSSLSRPIAQISLATPTASSFWKTISA